MDTQVSAPFKHLASGHGYEVLELIDQGGFGDIFTVRPIASPRSPVLALKRLSSRRHVTEDNVILDEIRAMLALRHRHIVRIRDVILDGHVACIVMDLAGLGNLEALLRGDRTSGSRATGPDGKEVEAHFGEDFVVRIFSQLLSALVFCHSRNVAHRDLQPANVLLLSWRRAVLADFGLATPLWDSLGNPVTCRDFLGRDPYLAPEVRGQVPHRPGPSDVWSLGCLLVFLTTRNHPNPQVLDSRVGQADNDPGLCCEVPNGQISSGQISVIHVSENLLSCDHASMDQLPIDYPSSAPISDGHVSNAHLSQGQASSDQCVHQHISESALPSCQFDPGHLSQCEQLSGEPCSSHLSLSVRLTVSDSSIADPSGDQSIDDHCIDIELTCRGRESEESVTLEAICDQGTLPDESALDAYSPGPGPDIVSMNVKQRDTQDDSENIVNNNINVITDSENASREQSANQDSVLDDVSGTTTSKENACGRGGKLKFDHDETQQSVSDSRALGRGIVSVSTDCQNELEQTSCSFSPPFHSCPVCSSSSSCLSTSLLHLCCRMVDVLCKKRPEDRQEVENAEEIWRCALASLRFHA